MIYLLLVVILLVVLLFGLQYLLKKRRRTRWSKKDLLFCRTNWLRIEKMSEGKDQIMEADKLLEQMMKKRGFQGSVADMLKNHRSVFSDLDGLWEAHKLRNKLAHELDYRVSGGAARGALKAFRKSLSDLGLEI